MIFYITVDQAIKIHDRQIEQHGGLQGIRDLGLLTSAMEMPKSSFGGVEMYPTLFDKAAAYVFYIAKNHPFFDGNKRTAAFTALLFLRINGLNLTLDLKQYELLVIGLAEGLISKTQMGQFFARSDQPIRPQRKKKSKTRKTS